MTDPSEPTDPTGTSEPTDATGGPRTSPPPPQAPAAASSDWFYGTGGTPAAGPATAPIGGEAGAKRPARAWIAVGIGTAVIAVGAFVAVKATGSSSGRDDQIATGGRGLGTGALADGVRGEVTAVDGSTLTVRARTFSGPPGGGTPAAPGSTPSTSEAAPPSTSTETVTVTTDDDTVVTETVDGTARDLAVGDHVVVIGADGSSASKVTAAVVNDTGDQDATPARGGGDRLGPGPGQPGPGDGDGGPEAGPGATPPGGMAPRAGAFPGRGGSLTVGTITRASTSAITVKADAGQVEVALTADTEIHVSRDRSVDDIERGDTVVVDGDRTDDTVTADRITIGDGAFGAGLPGAPGERGRPGSDDDAPGDGDGATTATTPTTI